MKTQIFLSLLLLFSASTSPAANFMVKGGSGHSLALDGNGTIHGWGYNKYGALGDGSTTDASPYARTRPGLVSIQDVASIAAGQGFSIAVKTDGSVWTWGYGYLGHGAYEGKTSPTQVSGMINAKQAASGLYHTLILTHGGKLWAWGNNSRGAVGDGTNEHRSSPVLLTTSAKVTSISAFGHSLALMDDGAVWAWGENSYGQTGNTPGQHSSSPSKIAGLSDVVAVAAGRHHSLALKSDGTVWAWGQGLALGNGTNSDSAAPVQAAGLSNITAIAAGDSFSLALKNDGTVWVFGIDGYSITGSHSATFTPRQVAGLTSVKAIGAGFFHAMAVLADGTVKTWGLNDVGQLGDGQSGTSSATPQAVVGGDGSAALVLQNESTPKTSVDRLFNWAESALPDYFNPHTLSLSANGYYYRCYATNQCLGETGGAIIYYNGTLNNVGELDNLLNSLAAPGGF